MMRRLAPWIGLGCVGLAAAGVALTWHPAIPPVSPPARSAFAPATIAHGAELAAIGDCAVCHTTQNGPAFAGGRAVPTPFGPVYATNITPDADTGIGQWDEPAFRRAMRDGIDRAGRHLYPVLPYPHFTRATDDDIAALYAFVMTRTPVRQDTPGNGLGFPFDQRWTLAAWNLLFLRPGPWQPDPAQDPVWNRGAYLVEAVGHCGACHSPHNTLGAEQNSERLAGGIAEGWYAPPLQDASPAPVRWTTADIETYLGSGYDAHHGAAAGPMTAVTDALGRVPEADIHAIATYIAALMPASTPATPPAAAPIPSALFAGACAGCHAPDAPMTRAGAPLLSASTAVGTASPLGAVQAILNGIPWREGKAAPYMPAFADTLTDAQVAELATYVRQRWGGRTDTVTTDDVRHARLGEGS